MKQKAHGSLVSPGWLVIVFMAPGVSRSRHEPGKIIPGLSPLRFLKKNFTSVEYTSQEVAHD
jgi:hypothetical protein